MSAVVHSRCCRFHRLHTTTLMRRLMGKQDHPIMSTAPGRPTSPATPSDFGRYLRQTRQARGLSIRQLGAESGVSFAFIARLESGEYEKPGHEYLTKLARALDVPEQDLLALAGYTFPEGLPGFEAYLRTRYDLPEEAIDQLDSYFDFISSKYDLGPDKG